MGKVRQLIERIPYIGECTDPERFSARNLMVFDYEIDPANENVTSVFAYKESDKTKDRLAVLEIPAHHIGNREAYSEAMTRLRICMLMGDRNAGRIESHQDTELTMMIEEQGEVALYSAEIDEILPVEAATRGVWSD